MYRSFPRGAVVLAVLALSACSRSTTPPITTPTVPSQISETFEGTLTVNGGVTKSFTVTGVGLVTAIVNELTPNTADLSLSIGLELGTWNGTSCQLSLNNDNTGVGSGIAGQANTLGDLCARVYDVGKLTEPVTFSVTIKHY